MAETEQDRRGLLSSIDNLEREKRQVQAENARIIEENRALLEQLDGLNKAVTESDAQVKTLSLTLESATLELRKLTASAARAAELEAELNDMEAEHIKLHAKLMSAREDERSAVQRWKLAESTLRDLHDQVDRIEKEAREERERHAELVQRMERRRAVERELDGAAGRLKGAAAASGLRPNQARSPSTVVSSFVRDILQDNANLQMGIMELREMLESSNQEVENLRDQFMAHQPLAAAPVSEVEVDDDARQNQSATTLSDELQSMESERISQEFHVHHHYHTPSPSAAPSSSSKEKIPLGRRAKKRRPVLAFSPAVLHSASNSQLARRSGHRARSSSSSSSTILSQTSASIPPGPESSIASSPTSAYRPSSIFDRGFESSQPTSPESTVFPPSSPLLRSSRYRKGSFDAPPRSTLSWSMDNYLEHLEDGGNFDQGQRDRNGLPILQPVIPEESEDSSSPGHVQIQIPVNRRFGKRSPAATNNEDGIVNMQQQQPQESGQSLRKSTSHDSLLSVAGMDIHTPIDRDSRMGDWHSNLLPPSLRASRRMAFPSVEQLSTPPVISTTTVMADRGSLPGTSKQSSRSLLASVAASSNLFTETSSTISEESGIAADSTANSTSITRKTSTLGRRVGGWVRGRWGMATIPVPAPVPVPSGDDSTDTTTTPIPASSSDHNTSSSSSDAKTGKENPSSTESTTTTSREGDDSGSSSTATSSSTPLLRFRSPGVNQKGPILGLRPPPPAPVSVQPEGVDEDLLTESLAE